MRSRYRCVVLLSLVLAVGCGKTRDEGAGAAAVAVAGVSIDTTEYTISDRVPGEGSTVRRTFQRESSSSGKEWNQLGLPAGELAAGFKRVYACRETIEEFPDGAKRPTRVRVRFDVWRQETDSGLVLADGLKDRIVDRAIIVENRGAGPRYRAADGGALGDQLDGFFDQWYDDSGDEFEVRQYLPDRPVRIGERWSFPMWPFVRPPLGGLDLPYDREKSKGWGKLTGVWNRDGRKYGRVELSAELVWKPEAKGASKLTKFEYGWAVELCIDGSRHDVRVDIASAVARELMWNGEPTGTFATKAKYTLTKTEETVGKAAKPPGPPKAAAKGGAEG